MSRAVSIKGSLAPLFGEGVLDLDAFDSFHFVAPLGAGEIGRFVDHVGAGGLGGDAGGDQVIFSGSMSESLQHDAAVSIVDVVVEDGPTADETVRGSGGTGDVSPAAILSQETSIDGGSLAQAAVYLDPGPMLMCGCPACVAARGGGDKDAFAATGAEPTQSAFHIAAAAGTGSSFTAGAAQAPASAIDALVNEYDYQWGSSTPGTAVTVTYSFLTSVPGYYATGAGERTNFVGMNATQKQAARDAFGLYAEVSNISFVEVAPGAGSINLGTANLGNGIGGWAYYPYPGYSGSSDGSAAGDVWITNRYASYANPTQGSWEYLTFIHEIGHAIGMKHPGNYNAGGGGTGGPYLPAAEDNHQYTVMSYSSGPTYGVEPITPQIYDIAAIQYLYGVDNSTRAGNDTYTFSTSQQVKTIWDGAGNDTFDASNQLGAVTIDLHPGSFSSIAGTNNIAIAFGAAIENAIGSNYNDTLRANDAGNSLSGRAGNDTLIGGIGVDRLTGGSGKDTMTGGAAADVFAFVSGDSAPALSQRDLITDFVTGTDKIDLTGIDANTATSGIVDAFRFLATSVFDGLAAALNYFFDSVRGVTVLQGYVNSDSAIDFAIDLTGNKALNSADFALGSLVLNYAPVVTVSNKSGTVGQSLLAASLFSVSDGNGDSMTKYQFWDGTAGGGYFTVNGVSQSGAGMNQILEVTAAQLAQTSFVVGSGVDTLYVRAFDGSNWSTETGNWPSFLMTGSAAVAFPLVEPRVSMNLDVDFDASDSPTATGAANANENFADAELAFAGLPEIIQSPVQHHPSDFDLA